MTRTENNIFLKQFGTSDEQVTIVGLGGEGVLRTYGKDKEAVSVIEEAIDQGITYFDSARAYAGSEKYYGLVWPKRSADRARVFQTSKSAMRTRDEALADLEQTLTNLRIDCLDLWQIHDVRTEEDFEMIVKPQGALEAFLEAKQQGMTRFIGVTGHHSPEILTRLIKELPVDSVLMPVNPVEGYLGGFLTLTLPEALKKGIAVIGMKVLGASHYLFPDAGITSELLIRFALSYPITLAIIGCSTPDEVKTLASVGRSLEPMSESERQKIINFFAPQAERLAYYRGVI